MSHFDVSVQVSIAVLNIIFIFNESQSFSSEQANIFAETAYPVCENVVTGYNGTIFAYGQTGTGKTFTITGVPKDNV